MSPIASMKNLGSSMLLIAFALCILTDINPGVEGSKAYHSYFSECNLAGNGSCYNFIFYPNATESLTGTSRCEIGCLDIYEPLCGTDGKTYPNKCTLFVENNCDDTSPNRIRKAYDGECKANAGYPDRSTCIKEALKDCISIQIIICGTDGIVYGDPCQLSAKNKCDDTSVGEAPATHCQ